MTLEELQALLQPSQADRDNALNMGLLQAGLGILAHNTNKSNPMPALGAGGLMGLQGYQQSIDRSQHDAMRKIQAMQLLNSLKQQEMQQKVPEQFASMIDGLRGGSAPKQYQDQVSPEMVGSKGIPQADATSPEEYFKGVAAIPDSMKADKLAAYEAGFRKWPQYRPVTSSGATNRDPATTIGAYGAMLGAAGLKGGDEILKFAGMLSPTELKGGSIYENRLTGQREFIPQMKEGQMPDGMGGMKEVPGFFNFTRGQKQAEISPIDAARLKYETGVDVTGGGQSAPGSMSPKDRASVIAGATTGANEDWLKNSYRPTLEAAKSADNMLTTTQALRNIDMNTGWGTEAKAGAANILTGLGIAPKNAELYATKSQQFQSQAMTRLWEVLNTAKGPQTEGDADRAKATFASLKNTKDANTFVIDLAEATARRDKLRAAFYSEAMPVARDSGDLTAVDRKWREIQRSVWDDPIMAKWKKK